MKLLALFAIAAIAVAQYRPATIPVNGPASITGPLSIGYTVPSGAPPQSLGVRGGIYYVNGQPESIGQRLRRLERAAASSNTLAKPPLIAPSAWQSSTAYTQGNVVTNGGNMYICQTAGTSAGSGGPSGTGASGITDNTAVWYYYGVADAAAVIKPNITIATSQSGGLTLLGAIANPQNFYFTGGPPVAFGTLEFFFPSVTLGPATGGCTNLVVANTCNNTAGASFWTDAPVFQIVAHGSNSFSLVVDGTRMFYGGLNTVYSGGTGYITIDWTSAGGRQARLYTIEDGEDWSFRGVAVDSASKVWAPTIDDRTRVVVFGDSTSAGAIPGPITASLGWPSQVGKFLGWSDVWNLGIGGTGYTTGGTTAGFNTFSQHTSDGISAAPDMVIVMGSINDDAQSPSSITASAMTFLINIRTGLPNAPIIVMGDYPSNRGPSSNSLANENAVKAAVTSLNDPLIWFIPVSTDPSGSWLTGTGTVSATTSGNSSVYISNDGIHPIQNGIDYYARKAASAVRTVIQQIP